MSSVDNRIVNMHFNSNDFQAGAADAGQALTDLEKTIAGMSSTGGLEEMGSSVDAVATRFGALQIAGVAALATIAATATSTALSLGRDLLGSITSTIFGAGAQRAIDIQQAKFQFRGLGLDVEEVMANALEAVQGTAFGLQEAATAATQFGGSGVKAGEDMTIALRSISGIAAQTGRSYSEIAQIMTSIAGTGALNTQDLMQFGVRGLDVTGALAEQMGKTQAQIREMVSAGEIDFKEFSAAMDKAFGKNATKANRTFTGALANMKAALSRIGADFFTPIIKSAGDIFNALGATFDKLRSAMDPVSKSLGKMTAGIADNTVKWLESLKVVHLLQPIIQGFKNIFAPLVALFEAVGEAWLTVFPSQEHQSRRVLFTLATAFELITKPLAWLAEQIPKITPLFVAMFEVFRIGWTIIGGLGSVLGDLVSKASDIGSNIVEGLMGGLTGTDISDTIVKFANSIIEWIKGALGIHSPAAELVPVGTSIVQGIAEGILGAIKFIFSAMASIGGAILDGFKQLFGDMDALDWAAMFNALLTGGLLFALIRMSTALTGFIKGFGETLSAIGNPIGSLTDALKGMQDSIKPPILIQIAIAVGTLTASLIALSLIPKDKLIQGTVALAGVIAVMLGAIKVLALINPENVFAASGAMILLSTAMLILAGAVAAFGQIDPNKLGQGLTAMAISLTLMIGAVEYLGALGPVALAGAGGIFIVSAAMVVLAGAVAAFGQLNPEKIGRALTTMAIALALMVGAVSALGAIGPAALAGAGGIFIVASAMVVLAGALAAFAATGPEKNSKSLTTMAVALGLISVATAALGALGPATLAGAGAIFIVASAMVALASALAVMGKVGPEKMSQGLTSIAVGLGIFLAAAAIAAIGPVSIGLGVLALSMLAFGAGVALFGAGLLAAATAFAIFAAVAGVGTAAIITALSAIIALLPVFALQLANSIVVFIEAIAAAAPRLRVAIGAIIKGMLGTIRDAMPEFAKTMNKLIDTILKVVRNNYEEIGKIFNTLIKTGLQVIRDNVDDFVQTGVNIIEAFMRGIRDNLDNIIRLGTDIVIAFIRGIGQSATRIVKAASDTILDFVEALPPAIRENSERLRKAGLEIAYAIVDGITGGLLGRGVQLVEAAVTELVEHIPGPVKTLLGISSPSKVAHYWGEMIVAGLANGIRDNISNAVGATIALANAVIAAGDKVVAKAQRESRRRQISAERAAARAKLSDRFAKEAERAASQSPKNKALQRAAKEARNLADKQAKAAEDAQRRAEAASQKVQDVQAFRDADKQGKGDILTEKANALTDRAIRKLAEANAAALAARKATGKERDRLQREAKQAAAVAKKLADQSKAARKRADDYYAAAVKDRIEAIRKAQEKERQAAQDEREFNEADDEGKAAILQDRADAARKKAEAARKQSEALINQARKLAKTDAARSQRLLDRAERLAQQAQEGIDQAKADQEAAFNLLNQDTTAGVSTGVTLELSKSAMEDAASAIDRYTKSLQQAEEAAQAATPVYQFVQNNTSPESLTDTEIYRQTKNLLSTAEIKMVAST